MCPPDHDEKLVATLHELREPGAIPDHLVGELFRRRAAVVQLHRQGWRDYAWIAPAMACGESEFLVFSGQDVTLRDGTLSIELNSLLCRSIEDGRRAEPFRPAMAHLAEWLEGLAEPFSDRNRMFLVPRPDPAYVLATPLREPAFLTAHSRSQLFPLPGSNIPVFTGESWDCATVTVDFASFGVDGQPRGNVRFNWHCVVRAGLFMPFPG